MKIQCSKEGFGKPVNKYDKSKCLTWQEKCLANDICICALHDDFDRANPRLPTYTPSGEVFLGEGCFEGQLGHFINQNGDWQLVSKELYLAAVNSEVRYIKGKICYIIQEEKPEIDLTQSEFIADLARAQAEEAMIFYSPTKEGYRLRAKNSYQKGFIDGIDYATQPLLDKIKEHEKWDELQAIEIQGLKDRIKELEEKQRWIPVEEMLPEDSGKYLTIDDAYEVFVSYFVKETKNFAGLEDDGNDEYITHWQPLPTAPTEGERKAQQ